MAMKGEFLFMAVNEQIVTGRKFRKLVDEATKLWQRISFWTKASDVEFNDGSTAETKMGAINGITDSLASTSSNVAASAKALNQLNNKLAQVRTYVGADGKLHSVDGNGADTVLPFKVSAPTSPVVIENVDVKQYLAIKTYGKSIKIDAVKNGADATFNQYWIAHPNILSLSEYKDSDIFFVNTGGTKLVRNATTHIIEDSARYDFLLVNNIYSGNPTMDQLIITWI